MKSYRQRPSNFSLARFEHAHASYPGLSFRPTGLRARIFGNKWNKGEKQDQHTKESSDIKGAFSLTCLSQRQYHKIQI